MMESFNQIINGNLPVLVDFYADWCGPCKTMAPVIQEVGRQMSGKARVLKINVEKNQQLAYQYGIQAVPTFAIFRHGRVVWRHSGTIDKNSIVNHLSNNI
jgi:thioredoxin 1